MDIGFHATYLAHSPRWFTPQLWRSPLFWFALQYWYSRHLRLNAPRFWHTQFRWLTLVPFGTLACNGFTLISWHSPPMWLASLQYLGTLMWLGSLGVPLGAMAIFYVGRFNRGFRRTGRYFRLHCRIALSVYFGVRTAMAVVNDAASPHKSFGPSIAVQGRSPFVKSTIPLISRHEHIVPLLPIRHRAGQYQDGRKTAPDHRIMVHSAPLARSGTLISLYYFGTRIRFGSR